MRGLLAIGIMFCFFACASGQKESVDQASQHVTDSIDMDLQYLTQLEQDLVGTWINNSLRVWVKTYNNTDTSFIVDINEDTWEMKMSIKPIITVIRDDGTYISEFRNSFDSLIYRPEGTWMIDGDSLYMEDHQDAYRYQIFIDGDQAEFKSIIDWDKDGEVDDEYFGIQLKSSE